MAKLLSILSLILAIVLFPPATLAVISNNAIPGDATYPIKRSLENIILAVVSVNPTTKAWFSTTRSGRRYKEFTTLIAQGKKTSDTLNELVEQTNIAAGQIAQVTNEGEKAKLIEQLSASIEKYDQGLEQFTTPDNNISQSTPRPTFPPTSLPTAQPTPRPTTVATPSPSPQPQTPIPTIHATPRPTSPAQPTPTPAPVRDEEAERQRHREIEEARRRLEEIKKKLEEQRRERQQRKQESNDRKERKENLTPKEDADKIEEEKP